MPSYTRVLVAVELHDTETNLVVPAKNLGSDEQVFLKRIPIVREFIS